MSNLPLVATKMQPFASAVPVLRRSRLFSPNSARLTYIVAPAGTGKSTLLAERPGAWLHLSSDDADLPTFLLYFIESIARRYPGCCAEARDQLLSRGHFDTIPEGLVSLFINQMGEYAKAVEIVLDDLHLCFPPQVSQWLDFLLRNAPANLTLVVATRHQLDLPLAWLRARALLRQIEEPELAFTLEEARQVVCDLWRLPLSDSLLEVLWNKSQGWVTALQLSTQALSTMPSSEWESYLNHLSGAQEEIYEYLASEVFRSLPEEIQNFVLTTSCVEEWTPPLAAALSQQDVLKCSAYLQKHRLFLQKVGPDTFRYHPLFREFLLDNLKPRSLFAALHQRAARYWLEVGQPLRALEHYDALQDVLSLCLVLEGRGLEMILQGHQRRLEGYLLQIPASVRANSAPLCLLLGLLEELRTDWEESERHFLKALALSRSRGDDESLCSAWAHLCQSYLKCDRHDELLAACGQGLSHSTLPRVRAQLLCWRGLALLQTGRDWNQGYSDILEAYQLMETLECPFAKHATAVAYGFVYLFARGQIKQSLQLLGQASDDFLAGGMPMNAYFLTMNRAVVLLLSGEAQRALRLVEETLLESRRAGHLFVFQGLETLKIMVRLDQDTVTPEMWQRLDSAEISPQFRPYLLAYLLRYHCRQNRAEAARVAFTNLRQQMSHTPEGFYALECNLALAQYYRFTGEANMARELLESNLQLCHKARAEGWEQMTRQMLAAPDLPSPRPAALPALHIQSLGPLRISFHGAPLKLTGKGFYRTTLVILKLLLASGERHVSIDQIIDAVWGDSPPQSARKILTVHMSSLRKALQVKKPIERLGDSYRLNHGPDLQVDSIAFEQLCQRALRLARQGDQTGAQAGRERAKELWNGPFLVEELYSDWVLQRRQELKEQFSRLQQD